MAQLSEVKVLVNVDLAPARAKLRKVEGLLRELRGDLARLDEVQQAYITDMESQLAAYRIRFKLEEGQ